MRVITSTIFENIEIRKGITSKRGNGKKGGGLQKRLTTGKRRALAAKKKEGGKSQGKADRQNAGTNQRVGKGRTVRLLYLKE